MHYEIYVDKLWLTDFILNTYLLLLVRQTFGLHSRLYRLFVSAAVNAAVFVIMLLLPGVKVWMKLFLQAVPGNMLLLQAAFSFRTKKMVVKAYACMNGYGFLLGGTLCFLSGYLPGEKSEITAVKVLLSTGVTTLLVALYQYYKRKTRKNSGICKVALDFYGKNFSCNGLIDSGNSLYEPYGKRPVIVLEKQSAGKFLERVPPEKHYMVPYHSIGKKHGLLPAVEIPVMEVDSGEHREIFYKVVVAFTEEKLSGRQQKKRQDYQLILHPDFIKQEE